MKKGIFASLLTLFLAFCGALLISALWRSHKRWVDMTVQTAFRNLRATFFQDTEMIFWRLFGENYLAQEDEEGI